MSALLASKERQSPQNHTSREEYARALQTRNRKAVVACSFSLFSLSKTLAFLAREEAEAKESISSLSFVFVFLKIQNETKRSSREEEKHHALLCCCCRASSSSKKESVIGERERKWTKSALRF